MRNVIGTKYIVYEVFMTQCIVKKVMYIVEGDWDTIYNYIKRWGHKV